MGRKREEEESAYQIAWPGYKAGSIQAIDEYFSVKPNVLKPSQPAPEKIFSRGHLPPPHEYPAEYCERNETTYEILHHE